MYIYIYMYLKLYIVRHLVRIPIFINGFDFFSPHVTVGSVECYNYSGVIVACHCSKNIQKTAKIPASRFVSGFLSPRAPVWAKQPSRWITRWVGDGWVDHGQ